MFELWVLRGYRYQFVSRYESAESAMDAGERSPFQFVVTLDGIEIDVW